MKFSFSHPVSLLAALTIFPLPDFFFSPSSSSSLVLALDSTAWRKQSIYQLLTDRFARPDDLSPPCDLELREYCGGTWRGIINHLDYIQGMGFTAIWISPVVENTGEQQYHGYYTANMWKLNQHFGTAEDLRALSDALHSRGMYLMLDVNVNHVGAYWKTWKPSAVYGPFDKPEHYHPFCWIEDYNDQRQVEQCWLGSEEAEIAMADLNTENPKVVAELNKWVKWLVKEFKADGLRIDTVKHVRKTFWPAFEKASGVFCMGEVLNGDPDYTVPYQGTALESVLNFPVHFPLHRAFAQPGADVMQLRDMITRMQAIAKDVTILGTFLDNHDMARFAHSTRDNALRQNALAYPFLGDGIPIMYSGGEHGYTGGQDPFNREPMWSSSYSTSDMYYRFVTQLNAARQTALLSDHSYATSLAVPIFATDHDLVLHRGMMFSVFSSRGSKSSDATIAFVAQGLKEGDVLVNVLTLGQSGTTSSGRGGAEYVPVGYGSTVRLTIKHGAPKVLMPQKYVKKYETLLASSHKLSEKVGPSISLRPSKASTKRNKQGFFGLMSSSFSRSTPEDGRSTSADTFSPPSPQRRSNSSLPYHALLARSGSIMHEL